MKAFRSLMTVKVILGGVVVVLATSTPASAGGDPETNYQTPGTSVSDGSCPECDGFGHGGIGRCRIRLSGKSWARPPVLPPVQRYPKVYSRYWGDHVYRASGPAVRTSAAPSYPMIHTPTDTTQLGYTHVHVPYFYYRPEMLPPAPGPSWGAAAFYRGACYTSYGSEGYTGSSDDSDGTSVQPTPIAPTPPAARPDPTPIEGSPAASRAPVYAPQPDSYFTGGKS